MNIDVNLIEEFGFKASQKGFFKEWQSMSSSISKEEGIQLCNAAEMAYLKLLTTD